MGWTIKQTTDITGIPADTLRYYDKAGIVSPKRSLNGYRQYDDKDIMFLKNVIVMKYANFSLAEMKSIEELFNHSQNRNCGEIAKDILNKKITELRQVIDNYQKIAALLEELLPMIESDKFDLANKERINKFIGQIYEDIRNDHLSLHSSLSNRNEV